MMFSGEAEHVVGFGSTFKFYYQHHTSKGNKAAVVPFWLMSDIFDRFSTQQSKLNITHLPNATRGPKLHHLSFCSYQGHTHQGFFHANVA